MADIDRETLPTVPRGREEARRRREAWENEQRRQEADKKPDASDTSANWQEDKRRARDAIAGAEPFAEQIREDGEVRHHGLGALPWWQLSPNWPAGFTAARANG
jgi:hypothetical protein